jgi:predicted enzyme related to lactoylglutathione lyase
VAPFKPFFDGAFEMATNTNALNWFEIPANDFARAKRFYEQVLGAEIQVMNMGPQTLGFLPHAQEAGVGGAIVHGTGGTPSNKGTMVYLNGGDNLADKLARVTAAGGKIAVPKTEIGNGFGFFAHFEDSEGNLVGLHSMA